MRTKTQHGEPRRRELDFGGPPTWLADHAGLRQALEAVGDAIERRQELPKTIAEMVAAATERVLAHFRQEEDGGHLSQAIDAAPHLAAQASGLLDEHDDLAKRLNEVRRQAQEASGSDDWWLKMAVHFQRFVRRFEAHEEMENRLLQTAYNEDLAAED